MWVAIRTGPWFYPQPAPLTSEMHESIRESVEEMGVVVVGHSEIERLAAENETLRKEHLYERQLRLDAQVALLAITEALDLRLADMGNGWKEGVTHILGRIETIVDEANRLADESDASRADTAKLTEALRKHGKHGAKCTARLDEWQCRYPEDRRCTCGLDDALALLARNNSGGSEK